MRLGHPLVRKTDQFHRKNDEELKALASGRISRLLRCPVPVFVFHSVNPRSFESQLTFLNENGYRSLSADEYLAVASGSEPAPPRSVFLTFDDGLGSFWAVAHPLLARFDHRATLFTIPGLVDRTDTIGPTLDDAQGGRASEEEVLNRESRRRFCSWAELEAMVEGGRVDVQSHSQSHAPIPVASLIVDFAHPGMPYDFHLEPDGPLPRLGSPIYRWGSRCGGRAKVDVSPELENQLSRFVTEEGGEAFFAVRGWRSRLRRQARRLLAEIDAEPGIETREETLAAVATEMSGSKKVLESRLGRSVQHFCYPWYEGTAATDRIAAAEGYRVVYYGFAGQPQTAPGLAVTSRLDERYVQSLPGLGRVTIASLAMNKLREQGARRLRVATH